MGILFSNHLMINSWEFPQYPAVIPSSKSPVGAIHGAEDEVLPQLRLRAADLRLQRRGSGGTRAVQRQQHGAAVTVGELIEIQLTQGPNARKAMPLKLVG